MKTVCIICLCLLAAGAVGIAVSGETSERSGGVKMKDEATGKEQEWKVPLDDTALATVDAKGIEVDWEDVKGLATPLMCRLPVQVCHHPHLVQVHPDMSVTLGGSPDARAIGIALGAPDAFPDMFRVTRRLHNGYMHILESEWENEGLHLAQTVLGVLPHDEQVTTGRETQYVLMRVKVTNTGDAERQVPLFLYLGQGGSDCVAIYAPFTASPARWSLPSMALTLDGSTLMTEDGVVLTYSSDGAIKAEFVPTVVEKKEGEGTPPGLNNALRLDLALGKGESRVIDFVMSDTIQPLPKEELPAMRKLLFDDAMKLAEQGTDALLAPAMRLTTPDERINNVYKALILSSMSLQFHDPENGWQIPRQGTCWGVWSWEFAHLAVPLFSIGCHQELDLSLKYFIDRQNGVGPKSANTKTRGEITSTKGSFTGDGGGAGWLWMNETGSIMWALAERYRYTRDDEWLKKQWPSILAAWDWVQTERKSTRVEDEEGKKVRYWGLLPSGMPGDVDLHCYQYTFNDGFTWLGMSEIAKAANEAKMPEANRLTKEADEYRQCILDVMKREEYVDPETKLLFVPNTVFYKETPYEKHDPYWVADGPVQLFDVGLLDPNDKRFADMVEFTRVTKSLHHSGILLGMAEHVAGGAEWYPNQTERSYFKCYLARGEIEKALLVLYTNLTYGMSNDTYQTTERFHTDNPNFTAFHPNGSGNGRNIDMLRRMVIDEQESGKLVLLRGCPRRWFEPGQSIIVENATTLYGTMAIRVKSEADTVTIEVEAPDRDIPETMTLVMRLPKDRRMKSVTVNGVPRRVGGDSIVLPREKGTCKIVVTR